MTARNRHHPDRVSQETKVTFCVQGVISPTLANLFLHYAFDTWMTRTFPDIPFAGGDARRFCASLGHRLF
jgi:retron-type reverse transcriptase